MEVAVSEAVAAAVSEAVAVAAAVSVAVAAAVSVAIVAVPAVCGNSSLRGSSGSSLSGRCRGRSGSRSQMVSFGGTFRPSHVRIPDPDPDPEHHVSTTRDPELRVSVPPMETLRGLHLHDKQRTQLADQGPHALDTQVSAARAAAHTANTLACLAA